MRTITCRNVDKYVQNYNKEITKNYQTSPAQSRLAVQSVLGIGVQPITGTLIFPLNGQEVLYYSSQYFTVHNLITKQTIVLNIPHPPHPIVHLQRFMTKEKNDLIISIHRGPTHLYLGQLEITGSLTQTSTSASGEGRNYKWKINRLSSKQNFDIQHISYHRQREFLFLLASQEVIKGRLEKEKQREKCLWVYDMKRECLLMSPEIKPSSSKAQIDAIWITQEVSEIYIMGINYFRFWTINFNQKTLKQSNYRNIQRSIKGKRILKIFEMYQTQQYLTILTQNQLVLVAKNQLIDCLSLPTDTLKQGGTNKQNIQAQLQSSLNQIYRMKFMFDQEQQDFNKKSSRIMQVNEDERELFYCATDLWAGDNGSCFMVASGAGRLFTYCIGNKQVKLINQIKPKKNHSFDIMAASRKGQIMVFGQNRYQHMYFINKYSLSNEQNEQLKEFWGTGQVSNHNILAIDSPNIHQRVATLNENSTFRLWSFKGRQRTIIFQQKLSHKPVSLAMHPCGMVVAVNCGSEIKLMSILHQGLYQVVSAKTNYPSTGIRYTQCGNYLISNQQNLLIFYNPFTLKTIGYYQSPDIKSTILNFGVTPEGNYIILQTSDYSCYIQPLKLSNYNNYDQIKPCHRQKGEYTCFLFQELSSKYQPNTTNNSGSNVQNSLNIFIGCTQTKYMVLYNKFGKDLVAQFPVQDCYINNMCLAQDWLFVSTSKGTIRVYRWPILEQDCHLQVANLQKGALKLKLPQYKQYSFWNDSKIITKMHKIAFANKILVVRDGGIVSILTYSRPPSDRLEESGDRKKMMQIVNESYFMTKNQSQKRNRMIDKTQGDIVKVENQIAKEKSIMDRRYKEECNQLELNFQSKCDLHQQERMQYLVKLNAEIAELSTAFAKKQQQNKKNTIETVQKYESKITYEAKRNKQIQIETESYIEGHRKRISQLMQSHKQSIREVKNGFREKIIAMRHQFEDMVSVDYPGIVSKNNMNSGNTKKNISSIAKDRKQNEKRTSIKLSTHDTIHNQNEIDLNPQELILLTMKVDELKNSNEVLQRQLHFIKKKVQKATTEDESLQRQFQVCLQQYNSMRFSNLTLHSEVLKMRTQVVERKQIMDNKQEIINMAFQEREKLQNYKELVKGTLRQIHQQKQKTHQTFASKESELELIFNQMSVSHQHLSELKRQQKRLTELISVHQKDKEEGLKNYEEAINRLKQLRKLLLLQGMTDDDEEKRRYLQKQQTLNTIHFFKKRMSMQFIRERKGKVLKKSAMNMVIKQNKNLLQQCNQLRSQAIQYEHTIKNLGKRVGELNRMMSIQMKISEQKNELQEQRDHLQAIRSLFNDGIKDYEEVPSQMI